MEKTEVKNYMDLKNESCFKIKISVALCSNTILQHLQTHLFTIFVGKAFCCRFQFWLISGKKSQDDLAGLCLIKSNKRSNKWANQEGTYVRAPCPGLWELGPCTLPNLTVSLHGICQELKDYLKRREPDALQFGCLKTSVTAGFPLVSKEGSIAPRGGTRCTPVLDMAEPPPDCPVLGGRTQAEQAIGEHPANLWPGFFRQVLCSTFRKAYGGCVTVLKNRIWHRASRRINLFVLKHKEMLKSVCWKVYFSAHRAEANAMAPHNPSTILCIQFFLTSLCK